MISKQRARTDKSTLPYTLIQSLSIYFHPQFRSVFPCEAILYVEMSFWGSICCYEDFRSFLGLVWAWNPPPKPMGNMRTTKKCCLFKEYFRVVCFVCIQVQNVPPSCSHPFCRYADKMQDKGFQPACLFQRLDLFADMADEIEVLQHGGNHHENHVLSHEGKGQMFQLFTLVFPSRFSPPTMMPPMEAQPGKQPWSCL